ncbi:MAG: hypothetical protein KDC98_09790 [Planctomycetes bacterium]|nr:hypothetical protein [Planctomycetota bacterium]
MRAICHARAGVLSLLAAGCAAPIEMGKDFVTLVGHEEAADYRAVTGDDARLWMRRFEDPNVADLEFWTQALEYDFVQQRGYDLVAKGDVKNAADELGSWFQCAANVGGDRTGYLVAVWVRGREITVVEFAARAEVFAARLDDVRRSLWTVRG